MESLKITVVMVTYNRSKVVSEAIDCLQKQTYPIENIIIIDNCSTDDTLEVLSKRKSADPRIQFRMRSENGGYAAGLETGIMWGLSDFETDYFWMMDMTEKMLSTVVQEVCGAAVIEVGNHQIDFASTYTRLTMYEAIERYTGIDISEMDEQQIRQVCHQLHVHIDNTMGRGKLIDEIFGAKVEQNLIQPTFIIDYPIEMSPLCKKHRSKPGLVERFELFINCKEVANAYSELNDPIDQRERFEEQLRLAARGDEEAMVLDEDFLRSLEYGMPPTSGIGFGIDRLAMLLTNQVSIQELLFFPQMKPEKMD